MKELLEKILGQIKKTPSGVRAYEDLYISVSRHRSRHSPIRGVSEKAVGHYRESDSAV